MILVTGYCTSLALSLIFACTPLGMVWDVTITEGHCMDQESRTSFLADFTVGINRGKIYLATAGLNAATDVIMLVGQLLAVR